MTNTPRAVGRPAVPPTMPADDGFRTTTLFRSRKIRNAAALAFVLTQFREWCDSRHLPRPPVPAGVEAFLPFTLVITQRHAVATQERIGCLRFLADDGSSYLDQEWQLTLPRK